MIHNKIQIKRSIAKLELLPIDVLILMQGITHKVQVPSRIFSVGEKTSAKNSAKIDCMDGAKTHSFKSKNMTNFFACVIKDLVD